MNCIRSFVQVLFIILLHGYAFLMAGAMLSFRSFRTISSEAAWRERKFGVTGEQNAREVAFKKNLTRDAPNTDCA